MEQMELLKKTLSKAMSCIGIKRKQNKDKVIYKIIDKDKNDTYMLQCINSKSVFEANILEIIFDTDILHGLHPLQSCFIGIEYALYVRAVYKNTIKMDVFYIDKITSSSKFKLKYINRKGLICYVATTTNEEEIIDPKEAVFIDSIIKEFHPGESFYIGFCAGKKMKFENNIIYIHKDETNIKIKHIS
jgi:hypothetical protein